MVAQFHNYGLDIRASETFKGSLIMADLIRWLDNCA